MSRSPGRAREGGGLLGAAASIALTELRTAFRDRQTVVYTIVLPLAMYPLLFLVMIQATRYASGREARRTVDVGVATGGAQLESGLDRALAGEDPDSALLRLHPLGLEAGADAQAAAAELGRERESAPGAVDAVVLPSVAERPLRIVYDASNDASDLARRRLAANLEAEGERRRRAALETVGRDPQELVPFEVELRNVASSGDMGAFVLSFLMPLLFVVMVGFGSFFPAVDVTAGERERRTVETTLLLPVPRSAHALGKIAAVSVCALVAVALNLLGILLAAGHLLGMLGEAVDFEVAVTPAAVAFLAPAALAFVVFASAVMVAMAATADTYKQGQSLMGTVQMLFILPALVAIVPGVRLTAGLALVPVVNVVLAYKELLRGGGPPAGDWIPYLVTLAELALLAFLALRAAVLLLGREPVSGGASDSLFRRLALLRRAASSPR